MLYVGIGAALLLLLAFAGAVLEQKTGRPFSGGHGGLAGRVKRDAYSGPDFHRGDE